MTARVICCVSLNTAGFGTKLRAGGADQCPKRGVKRDSTRTCRHRKIVTDTVEKGF